MTERVALYARYSSDNQREASIADQLRLCRERAAKEGWTVAEEYSDQAISGATLILRPGVQALIQDALRGRFRLVVAEALDRISRDQEDTAAVYKRLAFAGVRIVTLAEGEISELHVGLKGTMNALFLKDLADKTRRGLRGRIEAGRSGGGLCYGYEGGSSASAPAARWSGASAASTRPRPWSSGASSASTRPARRPR
jgi:DNA invertase Pin-like site-specific DNA recombinase